MPHNASCKLRLQREMPYFIAFFVFAKITVVVWRPRISEITDPHPWWANCDIDPNSIAVQSGVDLILHLLYRAERRRYAGETMLVGIHHQFQSVGDLKLVEDRSQMMAYGRFRNEQPFADLFVSQPLAN